MLTTNDITELQHIYFEETGERISMDEAWEMANRLFRLFDILTRVPEEPRPSGSNSVSFDGSAAPG
jgi:hypothetical protein